jgi:hypothetical protein
MKSRDAVLLALLVVLAIVLAYHFGGGKKLLGGAEGFAAGGPGCAAVHQQYTAGDPPYNPYMSLNKQLDAIRGYRNDGYNQPPMYSFPYGLDAYHRSGAYLRPEDLAEAEREAWFSALDADQSGQFNTELAHEGFTDTMQYHTAAPALDYGSYVTDLVVDPRTRDNHQRWVEEMKPWSGVAMKVDNLEMDNYVDFIGLRRPQAVVQYNPLFITEIGPEDLAVNPPFRFTG